jgi:hypothetical protein
LQDWQEGYTVTGLCTGCTVAEPCLVCVICQGAARRICFAGWPANVLTADSGALLLEGEAALCHALRFLGQHLAKGGHVRICSGSNALYVLPVGGPDGVGPGRRNHAWLVELAALLGPRDVRLDGWQLSAQDLQALSRLDNMRSLHLIYCSVAQLSALTWPHAQPCDARPRCGQPDRLHRRDGGLLDAYRRQQRVLHVVERLRAVKAADEASK